MSGFVRRSLRFLAYHPRVRGTLKAVMSDIQHSEWHHHLRDDWVIAHMAAEVSAALGDVLGPQLAPDRPQLQRDVIEFAHLIRRCPVEQATGGCGFNGGLTLFLLARLLKPRVVIESGVFRGYTTWVLRQALPEAAVFCFEPKPDQIRHRDPQAVYSEQDWSRFDFSGVDLSSSLAFFDDHVDQVRRAEECAQRGVRHALFDDSFKLQCQFIDASPAFPTAAMLLEADTLQDGPLRFVRSGKQVELTIDAARIKRARDWVAEGVLLPDLHAQTGYKPVHAALLALKRAPASRG
jgi:hypothetical protein